jgi:hypothetical protein
MSLFRKIRNIVMSYAFLDLVLVSFFLFTVVLGGATIVDALGKR